MIMSSIGIMGSAFNPPTLGHKDLIQQASTEFDLIYLIPSFHHAMGKLMLDYATRCHLVVSFLKDIHIENCQILMIEHFLASNKPIYTYDLLDFLSETYPQDDISFIIGPDNAKPQQWKKFYRYQDVEKRWKLFVGDENLGIRSTQIRDCISKQKDFSQLTTVSVHQWIEKFNLYQE